MSWLSQPGTVGSGPSDTWAAALTWHSGATLGVLHSDSWGASCAEVNTPSLLGTVVCQKPPVAQECEVCKSECLFHGRKGRRATPT